MKERVSVYVDGFNFYYGLRSMKWRKYYWLDMVAFFKSFLKPGMELVEVNYFSAPIIVPKTRIGTPLSQKTQRKSLNQNRLFQANKVHPQFKLILGRFNKHTQSWRCSACNAPNTFTKYEEKKTDVEIGVRIVEDAFDNRFDTLFLVSADTDMVPVLRCLKRMEKRGLIQPKKSVVFFPPHKGHLHSDLKNNSDGIVKLKHFEARFKRHQLPESVILPNGTELKCPKYWQVKDQTRARITKK